MAVADSLVGIFRSFKVLQPITKYRLKVGRLQVDGDYAVLRDNLDQDPTILQLRSDELVRVSRSNGQVYLKLPLWSSDRHGSSGNYPPQNLISYARHWHLLTAHDYHDASILNLHVPTGKTWVQWIPLHHSQRFMKSGVEAYHPSSSSSAPGAHCANRPRQACLNEAVV